MRNRRNYYRMLHVQPDAPLAVIKASYRALMMKMRLHPDLGGDHETAALINAAFAVLSDPMGRQQYDQSLRERDPHVFPQVHRGVAGATRAGMTSLGHDTPKSRDASPTKPGRCVFCETRISLRFAPTAGAPVVIAHWHSCTRLQLPRRSALVDAPCRGCAEMSQSSSTRTGHTRGTLPGYAICRRQASVSAQKPPLSFIS